MVYKGPSRGCTACKHRRVKCDLGQPFCQNCLRRKTRCSGARPVSTYAFRVQSSASESNQKGQIPSIVEDLPYHVNEQQVVEDTHGPPESRAAGEDNAIGPFDITIDPAINELLVFWRSSFPSSDTDPWNPNLIRLEPPMCDSEAYEVQDHCRSSAFLAAAASFHAALTGSRKSADHSLQWRCQAMNSLRNHLNQGEVDLHVICCTQTLFVAELAARNFAAAKYHATFLSRVFYQQSGLAYQTIPDGAHHAFMWLEIQRATATFTRPMFNSDFPSLSTAKHEATLDTASIANPELLQLLSGVKSCASTKFQHYTGENHFGRVEAIQLSSSYLQLCGRFLHYSISEIETASVSKEQFTNCQRAAAGLAGLYCVRLLMRTEVNNKSDSFERLFAEAPRIATRLKTLLAVSSSEAQRLLKEPTHGRGVLRPELRLRLWILHVGSHIESRLPDQTLQKPLFETEMRDFIQSAGLSGKQESIDRILKGFFCISDQELAAPIWLLDSQQS